MISRYVSDDDTVDLYRFIAETCHNNAFVDVFERPEWVEEIEEETKGVAILAAYRKEIPSNEETDYLYAWCPWCRQFHLHSAGKEMGDGDGHRIAHCKIKGGPYTDNGYELRELGEVPYGAGLKREDLLCF